jgi:hypothetical protein
MNRTLPATALLAVAALALNGCFSVDVDVRSPSGGWGHRSHGDYSVLRPVPGATDALGAYSGIAIGPFTDATGGRVPPMAGAFLTTELRDRLEDKKLPSRPVGRTMVIRGVFTGYAGALVARVELVDAATGGVLGVARCVGSSGEPDPGKAVRKRAHGVAKAIVDWVRSRYPERDDD